jgi:hypothetical protein
MDFNIEMDVKKFIEEAKNASRIKWSVSAMNDGICSKFDGIPILSAGTMQFHCHQGVDIDLPQKNKRKQIKDDKVYYMKYILFIFIHTNLNNILITVNSLY